MCDCSVCKRIEAIQKGENPFFVRELKTGYVVVGDYQRFKGYTVFICKQHATELHELEPEFRREFLWEMSVVAEAVYWAFQPDKLNYELLGIGNAVHMHWHIFPRQKGDTPTPGPVWRLGTEEMKDPSFIPSRKELKERKRMLNQELDRFIPKNDIETEKI